VGQVVAGQVVAGQVAITPKKRVPQFRQKTDSSNRLQFDFLRNIFRPSGGGGGGFLGGLFGGGRFTDDGTQSPQSTGRDELFPRDCGRDTDKGTGKLCFPDGILCQNRLNRAGKPRPWARFLKTSS
jgi:hypothetical protein